MESKSRFNFTPIFLIIYAISTSSLIYLKTSSTANFQSLHKDHGYTYKFEKIIACMANTWMRLLLKLSGDVELNPGPDFCQRCAKNIDGDQFLHCAFCEQDFHFECCLELSTNDATIYLESKKLYMCNACEPSARRYFKLEKRLEKVENKLEILDAKLDSITENLQLIKSSSSLDGLEKKFAEFYEAESKKRNAVLFGLRQSDNEIGDIRQLVKDSTIKPSDIVYTFRDGPDHTKNGTTIEQFNKVVFATSAARNKFLAWMSKNRFEDLRARADLTFAQREANRKLRSELEQRQAGGLEPNLRIDYKLGKIVNFSHSHNTHVNFSRGNRGAVQRPNKIYHS